MEVFISWSGDGSHKFAAALKDWLPSVIQSVEPFLSSEDIAKGTRWFSEIGNKLDKLNFGIICLTPTNISEPWILFEAGALSKSIEQASVAPILLGMNTSDLKGPLSQFNATLANKEDILKLVKSINDKLGLHSEKQLETALLERVFEALWPELEKNINQATKILESDKSKMKAKPKREVEDILEELLDLNRGNLRHISEFPHLVNKLISQNENYFKQLREEIVLSKMYSQKRDSTMKTIESLKERKIHLQLTFNNLMETSSHLESELKAVVEVLGHEKDESRKRDLGDKVELLRVELSHVKKEIMEVSKEMSHVEGRLRQIDADICN